MNILYIATDVKFPYNNGGSRRVYETAKIFHEYGHTVSILVDKEPEQSDFEVYEGIRVYRKKMINIGKGLRKIFSSNNNDDELDTSYADFHDPIKPTTFKEKMVDLYRHKLPIHKWIKNIITYPLFRKILRDEKIDAVIERSSSYGLGKHFKLYIVDFIDILYSNRALRKADGVLSYFTTTQIPEFVNRDKIQVVRTCVDTNIFSCHTPMDIYEKEFGKEKGDFIVMYIGGMYSWHGIDTLLYTANILKKKNVKHIKFIIIGDGEVKDKMIELSNTLRLQNTVKFIDPKPMEEIPHCLSVADIGVSLNTGDSVGFKMLEYMACEVPTIITEGKIVPYIGKDGVDFFVVKPKDPRQLADLLIMLQSEHDLLETVALNGRDKMIKNHTWTQHYQTILDMLIRIRTDKDQW
jgi:glycosyltransferase involved in cell wall biosynthesis